MWQGVRDAATGCPCGGRPRAAAPSNTSTYLPVGGPATDDAAVAATPVPVRVDGWRGRRAKESWPLPANGNAMAAPSRSHRAGGLNPLLGGGADGCGDGRRVRG